MMAEETAKQLDVLLKKIGPESRIVRKALGVDSVTKYVAATRICSRTLSGVENSHRCTRRTLSTITHVLRKRHKRMIAAAERGGNEPRFRELLDLARRLDDLEGMAEELERLHTMRKMSSKKTKLSVGGPGTPLKGLPTEARTLAGWWVEKIRSETRAERYSIGHLYFDAAGRLKYDGYCYRRTGLPMLDDDEERSAWFSIGVEFDKERGRLFYLYKGHSDVWDGFGMMKLKETTKPKEWTLSSGYFVDVVQATRREVALLHMTLVRVADVCERYSMNEHDMANEEKRDQFMRQFVKDPYNRIHTH